jgi:Mn2+/Fe2+ NRAMP family transporter
MKDSSPKEVKAGFLKPWRVNDLPEPLAPTVKNVLKTIGPGIIVLMLSIGSGEWLIGPKSAVEWGTTVLWVCTVSSILQIMLNFSFARYALYCGEGVTVGFSRIWPGPKLWGSIWTVLLILSVSPGWAAASATALTAIFLRRIPEIGDLTLVNASGLILTFLVLFICSFGRSIERNLEKVGWIIVLFIVASLIALNLTLVAPKYWVQTLEGFLSFGKIPSGMDPVLLGSFAGYAGAGGFLNTAVSNWMKDKDFGMGSKVGHVSGLIGGEKVSVSSTGWVFRLTKKNLRRWKAWWRFVRIDQWMITWIGWVIGMYLCVLLAVGLIPQGTRIESWACAAYQGQVVSNFLGYAGWIWVMAIGAWALFSTQLGATEAFVRQITDMLWNCSRWIRERFSRGDIRRVYYLLFAGIVFYFVASILLVSLPLQLIYIVANMANVVFVASAIQILVLTYKYMPREIRPRFYETILILASIPVYWYFSASAFKEALGQIGFYGLNAFYISIILLNLIAYKK